MNMEKVPPLNSSRKEKSESSSPDSESFQDLMKVDKSKEVDLDQQGKRKKLAEEEDVKKLKSSALHHKTKNKGSIFEPIPTDADFLKKTKKLSSKDREKYLQKIEKKLEKDITQQLKQTDQISTKNIQAQSSDKKEKKDVQRTEVASFQIPTETQVKSEAISSKVETFFTREIKPLFTQTIGTMIHMEDKGISRTQVILNNPNFQASRFYGTEITIEKFSTNPTSFNITLTGSTEAVTIINNNMEGLYKAFQKANLGFSVNRISAEYKTKPLFKRKESVGDSKKEMK